MRTSKESTRTKTRGFIRKYSYLKSDSKNRNLVNYVYCEPNYVALLAGEKVLSAGWIFLQICFHSFLNLIVH